MNLPDAIPVLRDGTGAGSQESVGAWPYLIVILVLLAIVLAIRRARDAQTKASTQSKSNLIPTFPAWWPWRDRSGLVVQHQTRLTSKHSLHEVQWRGRTLLIGCTDNAIAVLADDDTSCDGEPTAHNAAESVPGASIFDSGGQP